MIMKNWKKEVLTIPNLLSLFRLVLIPVYVSIYLNATDSKQFMTAGAILAASCFTDALDGYIARRFYMISTLGKILDPLADKLTQFTLIICLSLKHPVLRPLLILFTVKELFQLVMGCISLRQGKMLPGALPAGKVCTAVLFVSLIALVLNPDWDQKVVNAVALTDGIFLVISFTSYILAYFGSTPMVQDLKKE